jgi:Calcineurin-like phosphoesterase
VQALNVHALKGNIMERRDFLSLSAAGGGAVFAAGLSGCATNLVAEASADKDFYFVQLSDTHWGFKGAPNPEATTTLHKAIASVNSLERAPDFIVFTGDLTHTTDDPVERRRRLNEFKVIASELKVKSVRFMPGEHDASLDQGQAYKEIFGETFYNFDHRGVHFIALDNVSDMGAKIGDQQLSWLRAHLAKRDKEAPMVVFTHRPLFDLAPTWDWATRDGALAMELLMPFKHVTVFYGHIHQEHHHMTGHIAHHSAKSLIFALPAPLSQEKRSPIAWDPSAPFKGLGWREMAANAKSPEVKITEFPVIKA